MITSKFVWDSDQKLWKLKWKVSKQVKVVLEKSPWTELKTAAVLLQKCPITEMKTAVIKLKRLPTLDLKGISTKHNCVPQKKRKFQLRVRLRDKRIPRSENKRIPQSKHVQRRKHVQRSKRGPQRRTCLKK